MKPSKSKMIGDGGELAIQTVLTEDFGWGANLMPHGDVGTDIEFRPCDDDGNDMAMPIGIQVKTGNRYFNKSDEENWYLEIDDDHYGYWTANTQIPRILVLRDKKSKINYWQWINQQNLFKENDDEKPLNISTEIQIFIPNADEKIYIVIPKRNIFDDTAKSEIIDFVSFKKQEIQEKKKNEELLSKLNTWSFDINDYDKSDWARLALFLPDLVMPHPNKGLEKEITWAEAVALSINIRMHEWGYKPKNMHNRDSFARKFDSVPYIEDAKESRDYGWRFAAAIHDIVRDNDYTFTEELAIESKLPKYLLSVLSITRVIQLQNSNKYKDIITLISDAINKNNNKIDEAWLLIHRSNANYELSKFEESKEDIDAAKKNTKYGGTTKVLPLAK